MDRALLFGLVVQNNFNIKMGGKCETMVFEVKQLGKNLLKLSWSRANWVGVPLKVGCLFMSSLNW